MHAVQEPLVSKQKQPPVPASRGRINPRGPMSTTIDAKRTVAELKELRALTGDEHGAQRVAFTPMWVKTRASGSNKKEEPVEVDYKLAEKDGAWRVQDIKTEGVSLVGSYRNQFVKIIKKDGFPALIKKMKDKVAKGDG